MIQNHIRQPLTNKAPTFEQQSLLNHHKSFLFFILLWSAVEK